MYKGAFDQFPPITYNTVRKLFSHLHFITSQSSKNRMNIDNLSSVWGLTLMHYEVIIIIYLSFIKIHYSIIIQSKIYCSVSIILVHVYEVVFF